MDDASASSNFVEDGPETVDKTVPIASDAAWPLEDFAGLVPAGFGVEGLRVAMGFLLE
jgi:hypothetical protein